MNKQCSCGCDSFRFNLIVSDVNPSISNTCSNCGHILKEHLELKAQSE